MRSSAPISIPCNSGSARSSRQTGFTLIEIMVVLIILGLLAAIVVPSVLNRPDEARQIKAAQDIRALNSSLKLYRLDNFSYPTQAQGLQALVQRPADTPNWKGPYIEVLPSDPWGNPYQYRIPGIEGLEVDLFSLGSDNAVGGEDSAADIGNWNIN